jgi:arylsulfatase A-like enzyme
MALGLKSLNMQALVIIARGLNLAYVGCYGNEWIATPNLDRLAAEGVVFDQHFADVPDPAGAGLSWRSGCYHFPPASAADETRPRVAHDLIQALTAQGITTVLVEEGGGQQEPAFSAGWGQVFRSQHTGSEDAARLERLLQTTGDALDRLEALDNWLLWLDWPILLPPWTTSEQYRNLYFNAAVDEEEVQLEAGETTALLPWSGPLPERVDADDDHTFARLQGSYAAMVTWLDDGLGVLVDELKERDLLNKVMLVVTSDRGLPLGEHGVAGAVRPWLHEELVHQPLIMRLPGGAEAGWRVSGLTQAVDLLPTLHDAFALAAPGVHGHSLLPLCRQLARTVRPYAYSGLRVGDSVEWALRTPEWALLLPVFSGVEDEPRPTQLYRKPEDRWELNNLIQHHQELAGRLEETLRQCVEREAWGLEGGA